MQIILNLYVVIGIQIISEQSNARLSITVIYLDFQKTGVYSFGFFKNQLIYLFGKFKIRIFAANLKTITCIVKET